MKKIAIIILNYKNWKDTVECISSLKNQTNKNFNIVVVDNYSDNGSFENLSLLYKNSQIISILKAEKNLGYAKGNNLGIKYAIEHLNVKQVLLVNNDTIFSDVNFIDYLINMEIDKSIGAVGPKIIGSDGKNQNPVVASTTTKGIIKSLLILYAFKFRLGKFLEMVRGRRSKNNRTSNSFILHGSAIYLTENYLNQTQGLYPKTFLYYEENILAMIMEKMNLKMQYTDDIHIYHKEDQSSLLSFNNDNKIRNKFELSSVKVALKVKYTKLKTIKKTINY